MSISELRRKFGMAYGDAGRLLTLEDEDRIASLGKTFGLTRDEVLRQLRFPFIKQITYADLRGAAQEQREDALYGKGP